MQIIPPFFYPAPSTRSDSAPSAEDSAAPDPDR